MENSDPIEEKRKQLELAFVNWRNQEKKFGESSPRTKRAEAQYREVSKELNEMKLEPHGS